MLIYQFNRKFSLVFEKAEHIRELQQKIEREVNQFCNCNTGFPRTAVTQFNEIVNIELTILEILPQLCIQQIPKVIFSHRSRFELATAIVMSGAHFLF